MREEKKKKRNRCGTWMSEPLSKLLLPRAMRVSLPFWPRCPRVSHTVRLSVRAQSVSQGIGDPDGRTQVAERGSAAKAGDHRRTQPIRPPLALRKQAPRTPCRSILSLPAFSSAPSAHAPAAPPPRGPAAARSAGPVALWEPAHAAGRGRPLTAVGLSRGCACWGAESSRVGGGWSLGAHARL